jgi:putative phosphoesterase
MHALEGVDLILHAGDVGSRDVLIELGVIAPVYAVYGNVDDVHTPGLEQHQWLEVEGWRIHVSHGHELGRPSPERVLRAYGEAGLLVYGHTHTAVVYRDDAHVVINPGAAGPRRFDVTPSLAVVRLSPGQADVETIPLA